MRRDKRVNRKPMDKLSGFDSREAMWDVIRDLKTFTVRALYNETILDMSSIRVYLQGLTNAGYLEKIVGENATQYKLVKDVGIDAPRVRKDGSKVTQGQGQINMWRTMRTLQTFSARELAVNSSTATCVVKETTAVDYCKHLNRAGYLRKDKHETYFFIPQMFTGPKPPMIQRVKRVWDQNKKKVMWREDGGAK